MQESNLIFSIFIIFFGAALLATLALYTRQSLLVAYIILGMILGPFGLEWVSNPNLIKDISHFGIIFLLFLLGLDLQPQGLFRMFRNVIWITCVSSFVFGLVGYFIAKIFHFSTMESLVIGGATMFSSTILGIKLLPKALLHQKRVGEVLISILLLQDLIAIAILLWLSGAAEEQISYKELGGLIVAFVGLLFFAILCDRFILMPLLRRFHAIHEYVFLVALGWCLGIAEAAHYLNLSYEIGAFIAGVSIAVSPISLFIAKSLEPLRDFFLILFFFSLGAVVDLNSLPSIIVPSIVLALSILVLKPPVYHAVLRHVKEAPTLSWELGLRLAQCSEFSLLMGYKAFELQLIGKEAFYLIQITTIITFIGSAYVIGVRYPATSPSNHHPPNRQS